MVESRQIEVLQTGGDDRSSRTRARIATVVALILVLVVGSGWLDGRARRAEVADVLRCVGQGEAAVTFAYVVIDTMSRYVAPALASSPPAETGEGLRGLVRDAAARGTPGVGAALAACDDVPVRAWHWGIDEARDRYRTYLAARLDLLEATVEDDRQLFGSHPEIDPLHNSARAALLAVAARASDVDAALPASRVSRRG